MNKLKLIILLLVVGIFSFASINIAAAQVPSSDNSANSGSTNVPTSDNSANAGNTTIPSQDNSSNSGTANVPPSDNSSNTGGINVPPSDNSANAGNTNTVPSNDNSTNTNGNSSRGSSNRRNINNTDTLGISDIKVTLFGSSIATTSLTRGQTYIISWSSSETNESTILDLVSISSGVSVVIGMSSNTEKANTFTWTVPTSTTLSDYILRFTSSIDGDATNSPDIYTVTRGTTGAGNNTVTTSGVSSNNSGASEEEVDSEIPSVVDSENSQTAAVGDANGFSSKYFLGFLILLLAIAGIILAREQRNKTPNSTPNK